MTAALPRPHGRGRGDYVSGRPASSTCGATWPGGLAQQLKGERVDTLGEDRARLEDGQTIKRGKCMARSSPARPA